MLRAARWRAPHMAGRSGLGEGGLRTLLHCIISSSPCTRALDILSASHSSTSQLWDRDFEIILLGVGLSYYHWEPIFTPLTRTCNSFSKPIIQLSYTHRTFPKSDQLGVNKQTYIMVIIKNLMLGLHKASECSFFLELVWYKIS